MDYATVVQVALQHVNSAADQEQFSYAVWPPHAVRNEAIDDMDLLEVGDVVEDDSNGKS